jgi:hypothetical protein
MSENHGITSNNGTIDFDDNLQSILDLMNHRVNGTASVTNDQIEAAVQNVLQQQQQQQQQQPISSPAPGATTEITASSPKAVSAMVATISSGKKNDRNVKNNSVSSMSTRSSTLREAQPQTLIIPDLGEYDELPHNDGEEATIKKEDSAASTSTNIPLPLKTDDVDEEEDDVENEIDWSVYETIPLGKQGAQMMTIFGDGKYPSIETVRATLYGTRCKIQCTIQDARHIRRQQTVLYRTAKKSIQADKSTKPGQYKQEWSTELLFRASAGYDPLAYHPKCGFGIEDLNKLHPEELNAYHKWDEMHSAAAEATTNAPPEEDAVEDDDEDNADRDLEDNSNHKNRDRESLVEDHDDSAIVGHLQERAAHFDVRTNKMGQDWYMKYSNIRQKGSFLPRQSVGRGGTARSTNVDAIWDATTRQKRKTGEHSSGGGGWTHMSASAVRFLHWIGFDPTSPVLPPPTDDVTAALAFLAYDIFGRIVEKAIFLRNCRRQLDTGVEINEVAISNYELEPGEQLTEQDIQRAMDDPDIKPVPLYSVESKNRSLGPQLYFGPGFEDRLEMEMEEMLWDMNNTSKVNDKLSKEELLIRQQEDDLFAQLAKPPTQDGIVALLQASQGKDILSDVQSNAPTSSNSSKRAKR